MPDDNWRWCDHVRAIAHERNWHGPLTNEEIDYILWEYTAFPVAAISYVENQLRMFFDGKPQENGPIVC